MSWRVNKKTFYLLLLIFPIGILAKIYQFNFTDEYNFGIMKYIFYGITNNSYIGMKSYDFPIKIYSWIYKIIPIQSVEGWSWFYTILFNIILFIILLKFKDFNKKEYIYIYSSMFILSWTVMNLNKDLIQLLFMLIVFGICKKKCSNTKKIVLIALIFAFESMIFRDYYIILSGLIVIIYIVINKELNSNVKKKRILKNIIKIFALFFISIFIYKYISIDSYERLINRRESLADMDTVTTIIQNIVPGGGYFSFVLNYTFNFIRILFPIELIRIGPKYIIFLIYQLYTTFIVFKSIKYINKENVVYLVVIIAYLMMLTASESDFGTLVRHQSVLFLFYLTNMKMINSNKKLEEKTNE